MDPVTDRWDAFIQFLRRLRDQPLTRQEDVIKLQELADSRDRGNKAEHEIRRLTTTITLRDTLSEVTTFTSADAGLQSFGLKLIPKNLGPRIRGGAFGSVDLAYKVADVGQPLERRHIAACKVQAMEHYYNAWTEAEVMRGIRHPHVVQFVGFFAVCPNGAERAIREVVSDGERRRKDEPENEFWILMEYANAGDLNKEILRHPGKRIPEPGVKYYALQIGSGLQYLHKKGVMHGDLSERNILLKYKRDGSKTCLLCDFGASTITSKPFEARYDIHRFCLIIMRMAKNQLPDAAADIQFLATRPKAAVSEVRTLDQLLESQWFYNEPRPQPPFPKDPTPLLRPEAVQAIGFMPQEHQSGSRAPTEQSIPSPADAGVSGTSTSRSSIRRSMSSAFSRARDGMQSVLCLPLNCMRSHSGQRDGSGHGVEEVAEEDPEPRHESAGHYIRGSCSQAPSPRVRHHEPVAVEVHHQPSPRPASRTRSQSPSRHRETSF